MLLELDQSILKQLLHCPQELEKAVNKAKSEYLQQSGIDHLSHSTTEQNCNQTKEELGEMIYELVNEKHPLEAAKITGTKFCICKWHIVFALPISIHHIPSHLIPILCDGIKFSMDIFLVFKHTLCNAM